MDRGSTSGGGPSIYDTGIDGSYQRARAITRTQQLVPMQANVCRTTTTTYKSQLTSSSVGLAQARPNYLCSHPPSRANLPGRAHVFSMSVSVSIKT